MKVFISYSQKDAEFVNKLKEALEASDIGVIIDVESLEFGDNLQAFLEQSVREMGLTIAVISKHSLQSVWVIAEALETLMYEHVERRKRFLPIYIDTSFLDDTLYLEIVKQIDASITTLQELTNQAIEKHLGTSLYDQKRKRLNKLRSNLDTILEKLANVLVADFSNEKKFAENLPRLIEAIKQAEKEREQYTGRPSAYLVPFRAPPLPPEHFIPRPDVTKTLKKRLLQDKLVTPHTLKVSAIYGMAGSGKSTLAMALASDPDVRTRFADGILWMELGQEPEDVLAKLRSWIQTLRHDDSSPISEEAASTQLRSLLHDKAVLLVVDNVWNAEHAKHFKVGGPRCHMLLTIRRRNVAEELHAAIYPVHEMTPSQSLELLARCMGILTESIERENALRLAKIVGHLPFALELAAARIARGVSWNTICNALEQENARLEALGGPHRETVLEASLNVSVQALRDYREKAWEAFVWLGILPEAVHITASMSALLWNVDEAEAAETLELLWNDALLIESYWVDDGERKWPVYRLHNLLYCVARNLLITSPPAGLGLTLHKARAKLLGKQGPFRHHEQSLTTESGATLFSLLAKAEPEKALRCLQKTIGTWQQEQSRLSQTVQSRLAESLEQLATWRTLFADAARLLLRLAEANDHGPASEAFVRLFNDHPDLAHTEAPPQERFSLLKVALESGSQKQRLLALDACQSALQTFTGGVIFESELTLRNKRRFWVPETLEELYDAYRQIWRYLATRLDIFPEVEQQKALDILLEQSKVFGSLGRYSELNGMVVKTIEDISQKSYADKKNILKTVIERLQSDEEHLPENARQAWERIKEKLTGHDFHAHMKRYVGMNVPEHKFDEEGKYRDEALSRIEALAQQAFEQQTLLRSELDWLVTTQAENGYHFGYALGKRDNTFSLFPTILEAQRHAESEPGVLFLSGYLRTIFEHNPQQWEDVMDAFTHDEALCPWVPELTWRSSRISDQAALRMLESIKAGHAHIEHFQMLVWGGVIRALSEGIFLQWIEFLLTHPGVYAIHIALDLYHAYYLRGEPFQKCPENVTFKLLTKASFSQLSDEKEHNMFLGRYWREIGKAFVKSYPSRSLELADMILEHFGERTPIFHRFNSPSHRVLTEITRQFPKEIWARITPHLEPPRDPRTFVFTVWLQGVLPILPMDIVWQWIDEDVEARAWYVATFLPKALFREENRPCWARELLIRYGDRKDVRDRLITNFLSCSSQSDYLQNKRQELLDFKKEEDNENVRRWIDEYVAELERDIERVKIEEERRGF